MQGVLWAFVIAQVKAKAKEWLEKHALDDNGCITRVMGWVNTGTLDDALRDDFWGTFGCLVETGARVALAALSDFHDNHPDPNVIGCNCKLSDEQMSQVFSLGNSLGVTIPAGAGAGAAINPAVWSILLELFKLFLESRKK